MNKLITVIVPVYNVEKYIRNCIESIINQTYSNLEIILVDDGSLDSSPQIIDEYAKKDKRIRVIHKENGGVSSARNAGLKIASGEYITFVDSDDTINSKIYEILYNLIKKYDTEITMCEAIKVYEDEEGKIIIPELEENDIQEKVLNSGEAIKLMIMDGNIGNFACTKLFKKELFNNITFPDGKVYEDAGTTYKVVHNANKIVYTNLKLYNYFYGRIGSITSTFTEKKILDSLEAYFEQYLFILNNYPEIKQYANITWVRMYTSAMEKICMNNYIDLWDREDVIEKYEYFKKAIDEIDKEILYNNLEQYRLISAVILRHSREIYKKMFKTIYNNLKNI
ncbi:MAG: glycosyltransferase [Clostridiales bacterium]|nr:glycosyltransferase [Clostridiales bacterium]